MNVMLIGGGGREHALAWKIAQSPQVEKLYVAPGSDAIARVADCVPIKANDIEALADFAVEHSVDLTMVGPEDPLTDGIVDAFKKRGLAIVGPTAAAARLEGSKIFAKELMAKYNIPTAAFRTASTLEEARAAAGELGLPLVVKADGLAAGKGVLLCHDREELDDALQLVMAERKFGASGDRVVIEELLDGEEASFIAFTDGKIVLPMASSQDHKRAFDGDQGPNTGGMGAYSPAPVVDAAMHERILSEVMRPTVTAMEKEGCPFSGVLYAGVMIRDGVPYVLEFNARFGDPETQPIMARLESDLVDLLQATAKGELSGIEAKWNPKAAVCTVMASGGYPNGYEKGHVISGIEDAEKMEDVVVFHAGTKRDGENWINTGGRVLGVTALGANVEEAAGRSYEAVEKINWKNVHYRTDIAKKAFGR